jgi:hypothetical protein
MGSVTIRREGEFHPDFYMEYGIGPVAIDMSTAILRMYTPQGFVIVADGRSTDREMELTGEEDETQKIFNISGGGHHIAFSSSGVAQLSHSFSLIKEILRVSASLSSAKCKNLAGYANRLASGVNRSLGEAKAAGLFKEFLTGVPATLTPGANGIAMTFLDAFYNGIPQRAAITFRHKDQRLISPDVVSEPVTPGARFVLGCRDVEHLLFDTQDPRFAAYRRRPKNIPPTLEDVGDCLSGYVLACGDPEALKIDPKCAMIGGRVHIAHVTPQGFQWQIPPLGVV